EGIDPDVRRDSRISLVERIPRPLAHPRRHPHRGDPIMTKALLTLALAYMPLALTSVARADLITWGPSQNITAASDVSLNGTLVVALDPWAMTFPNATVNGVTFVTFAPLQWNNGGWTLLNGSTTGDAGYDMMLD